MANIRLICAAVKPAFRHKQTHRHTHRQTDCNFMYIYIYIYIYIYMRPIDHFRISATSITVPESTIG